MRFASTASRLAGRRLHHPPYPHRRHQHPAACSRTAGGLALTAIEGRFAGFGLLASSNSTALRTATKAASRSIQLLSFDNQAVQAGSVRVTGCLDAIHPGIHNVSWPRRRRGPARPGRFIAGGPRPLTRRP